MQDYKESRVVVVGAGLAGLTAAAMLARGGETVTVFEKAAEPGGRARTAVEHDFHFNLGPHAWFLAGRATTVLQDLGVTLRGRVPQPSGAYAIAGDRLHALPIGLLSMLTTDLLPLRAKLQVARTLAALPRMDTAPFDSVSVAEWLATAAPEPAAAALLATLIRTATYVDSPRLFSAGAALDQVKLALKGNVLYLDGGWQQMVDALRDRARAFGAGIRTGVHVRELVVERGRVRGIRLDDGEVVAADRVVVATPPDAASKLGVAGVHTTPARVACLDLGLTRLPRPRARFALGIDRPLHYSVHSATAALAPAGAAVIHAAKYLDPRQQTDPRDDEIELEAMMDRLQPGWRALVAERRFLPSMTATYAVPLAAAGGLPGRPAVAGGGAAGLFLAGDWVGAEGQLANAAVVSAARAAEAVLRERARRAA